MTPKLKLSRRQRGYNGVVISHRLRDARKLAGLSMEDAALRLYCEKGTLSKRENYSIYGQAYSLEFLIKAAKLYGVTLDYLVGMSTHPEGDPLNNVVAGTLRATESTITHHLPALVTEVFRLAIAKAEQVSVHDQLHQVGKKIVSTLDAFVAANPEFEDMPKGAPVLRQLELLREASAKVDDAIERKRRCAQLEVDTAYEYEQEDRAASNHPRLSQLDLIKEAINEQVGCLNG